MVKSLIWLIICSINNKMAKPKQIEYDKKGRPTFFCLEREMHLRIEDNSGARCHVGGLGNICNIDGKICDIYVLQDAYEQDQQKQRHKTPLEIEADRQEHERRHAYRKDDGFIHPYRGD